ncbi:TPA: hypothetical protein MI737_05685 [Klebsiella pneumoniae]|uniref:hypothetical protein n=1 Tax=Klebsiella pneumoniae TaxID=573 RepID=UPI0023699557|nr:hypothetical protein [Klebsiella pneumoniae]ELA2040215.1 hypothetical protein [Klebsiella pneumoniae]WLY15603.1 hypothetical protein RA188_18840 [Klebsiella pneumoniae]HBY2032070.1 hypothetical protein [Klebsiella pneumoniae]HBY7809029.1 hypothetical protein [Klebsiella pneumoniae]HDK7013471.1 hypothetical protein [Klebsiella pneumoniae]
MREHESREPFAYIIQDKYERERGIEGHLSRSHVSKYVSQEDINEHEITCTPLYRHAQPAPVVDADDNFYSWFGREWAENYQHNQYTTAAKQMLGVMAESAWKAGRRAAMLQELQKSAGAEAICRSNENVQVLHTYSPAQSDCCPAQSRVAPAQDGNSPVVPDGYVMVPKEPTEAMMLHNSGCQHHAWDDPDCAMRQTRRLIWSHMLAAAPQEAKGE